MDSKEKTVLEKFSVKKSSIPIGIEDFWATGFSIMGGLG